MTNSTVAPPEQRTRISAAQEHVKTVFGDTPLGALVARELDEAKTFTFLGSRGGLVDRLATQIIRLQESQFRLPEVNGSK